MNYKGKTCIVVLGMHRSGTSALMGSLVKWGVPVGQNLMEGKDENPKGYYEDKSIYLVNEQILRLQNSTWNDVLPYADHWWKEPKFVGVRDEIRRILTAYCESSDLFGVKDPRLSRLLPLWLELFHELEIVPRFVTAVRSPVEVAASLWRWRGISLGTGILLWMQHMTDAERYTRGNTRTFVAYEDLLLDPVKVMRRIEEDIDIVVDRSAGERIEGVREFVDGHLRHHAGTPDAQLPSWVSDYYQILVRRCNGDLDDEDFAAACQGLTSEYVNSRDFFLVPELRAGYVRLASELRNMEQCVQERQSEIAQRDERLVQAEAQLREQKHGRGRLHAEIAGKNALIANYELQHRELKARNEARRREAHAKDEDLRRELEGKDDVIVRQNREIARLRAIEGSLSWRMLRPVRELLDKVLFPAGSDRGRWYLRALAPRHRGWDRGEGEEQSRGPEGAANNACPAGVGMSNSMDSAETRGFPEDPKPFASIIIPVWNQWRFTYRCLDSIFACTTDVDYEVVVVDDGSSDETREMLDRVKTGVSNIRVVRNKENLGFVGACNAGAAEAHGNYLVFLNNDTTVTPHWLRVLVDLAEGDPTIGAVGGKLLFENDRMQAAGSIIWRDGTTWGYGREEDPNKPEFNYVKDVDYCPAALLMVRAALFRKLGGFDPRYMPAYYEDADLCMAIRELGYRVVYAPRSQVHHHEFGSGSREKTAKLMQANRGKFVERWRTALTREHLPSSEGVLRARDRRLGMRLLVLGDLVPATHLGSGLPRSNLLLKYLAAAGFVITFCPLEDPFPYQPYADELRELGVELMCGDGARDVEEFFRDRAGYYDVIVVSRSRNAVKVMESLRAWFPGARIIYDAAAVRAVGEIRRRQIAGEQISPGDEQVLVREEIAPMRDADVVVAVSEGERTAMENLGIDRVKVWGYPVQAKMPGRSFAERSDLLFVGSFLRSPSPNEDAMLYFVEEILPRIRKRLDCGLHIVGTNHLGSVWGLAGEKVHVTGYLGDILPYYQSSRVFVVPSRHGAGIPIKLLDAMSYGIPAVVTPLVANQLGLVDGDGVLVGNGATEFAEKVEALYRDEALWKRLQERAFGFVRTACDPAVLKDQLLDLVGLPTKVSG